MDDDKSNNYIPRGSWTETAATCEDRTEEERDNDPYGQTKCEFSADCEKCQTLDVQDDPDHSHHLDNLDRKKVITTDGKLKALLKTEDDKWVLDETKFEVGDEFENIDGHFVKTTMMDENRYSYLVESINNAQRGKK